MLLLLHHFTARTPSVREVAIEKHNQRTPILCVVSPGLHLDYRANTTVWVDAVSIHRIHSKRGSAILCLQTVHVLSSGIISIQELANSTVST